LFFLSRLPLCGAASAGKRRDIKTILPGKQAFDLIFTTEYQMYFSNNLEVIMLEVTNSAVENLKTYLADNNIESAIRISLMQGG
jgi:hypothetical protein